MFVTNNGIDYRRLFLLGSGIVIAIDVLSGLLGRSFGDRVLLVWCVFGIAYLLPSVWKALRDGRLNVSCLLVLSVFGAILMKLFGDTNVLLEAVVSLALHEIVEMIEDTGHVRSKDALTSLVDSLPKVAHRVVGSHSLSFGDVDVSELLRGDKIRILAGETVPVDCRVVGGETEVDESRITGESMPVFKGVGNTVYGGSVNGNGVVTCVVERSLEESHVTDVVRSVEDSLDCDTTVGSFMDGFVAYLLPVTVATSCVMAFVIPVLCGLFGISCDASVWQYRALCVLVGGCPCAFLLAAPVSYVSAIAWAASRGIVVRGGETLAIGADVTHVMFDKTGTITTGHPCVVDVVACDGFSEHDVIQIAASMESASTHPLGEAIVERAREYDIQILPVTDVIERPGSGLIGLMGMNVIHVGSLELVTSVVGLPVSVSDLPSDVTTVYVAHGTHLVGYMTFSDAVRDGATNAISRIRAYNRRMETTLLSGDSEHVTRLVSESLGFDHYVSRCVPESKSTYIVSSQNFGDVVMMVGDGINDAPALSVADVGVAFGERATDVATSVADVVIPDGDLDCVAEFLSLSKRTKRTILFSVVMTFLAKGLVLLLSMAGIASMSAVMVVDVCASVFVLAMGLRLSGRHRF